MFRFSINKDIKNMKSFIWLSEYYFVSFVYGYNRVVLID